MKHMAQECNMWEVERFMSVLYFVCVVIGFLFYVVLSLTVNFLLIKILYQIGLIQGVLSLLSRYFKQ